MRIDVFSDPICPWCFLGKRSLDRALRERDLTPLIAWRPFQLEPDAPDGGLDFAAAIRARYGEGHDSRPIFARLEQLGAALGIAFDFAKVTRLPQTIHAHRLLRWAGAAANDVADALFRARFEQGLDIGDPDVLARLGATAGVMEEEVLRARLATEEDIAQVRAESLSARRAGVNGVPHFVFDNRLQASGALDERQFAMALAQAGWLSGGASARAL